MRRALGAALVWCALVPGARGEPAIPGHTLVLHRGLDPAIVSAMPGGAAHDGRLAFVLPRSAPTTQLLVAMPGARPRGPAIDASGRVFVGTSTGLTLLAQGGAPIGEVAVGALDCAPVLVPGGDVIALSRSGMLARIAPDGTVIGRASTDLGVRFAPLVLESGGLAVVAASRTLAYVGSDLEVRFSIELPDGLALSPTLAASGRWAIAAGSELVVVDPTLGEIVRALPLPGRAAAPAARASDGTLYIVTVEGALVSVHREARIALTIALGARLPEPTTSDRSMIAIAPDGDVLVIVPSRGVVRIAPDGTERWTRASETPFVGALSVDAEGRVAALDRLGHLSVLAADGSVEWTAAVDGAPLGAALVTREGRIVVATERGVAILGPT